MPQLGGSSVRFFWDAPLYAADIETLFYKLQYTIYDGLETEFTTEILVLIDLNYSNIRSTEIMCIAMFYVACVPLYVYLLVCL